MNIKWLSASNLKTFKTCAFQYYLKYTLKLEELRAPSKWTAFGKAVHEVLEQYAKGRKDWEAVTIEMIEKHAPWQYTEEGEELRDQYLKDGNKLVKVALDRPDKPFERKILAIEGEFNDEVVHDMPSKGYMDLVTEIDPQTLEIRDWKTGRPEKKKVLEKDMQCIVYSAVSFMKWPQYQRRIIKIDFLKREPVEIEFTEEQTMQHMRQLATMIKKVKDTEIPTRILDTNRKMMWKCKIPWCIGPKKCDKLYLDLITENK